MIFNYSLKTYVVAGECFCCIFQLAVFLLSNIFLQHDEPVVEDDDDEEDEDDDEDDDDEEDDNAEGKLENKIYCFCACDFYSIFIW
jgi:hypothetical protein